MSAQGSPTPDAPAFDPVRLAVLSNRLEAIVREMTNTLLRTGRSAILNTARDFSCSIVTAEDELLAAGEGLPIHVVGSQFLTESIRRFHPDVREGDAFLHNDPYLGNTHHADYSVLVPVFHEGEHLFTAVAKAHQADCGNAVPTTYSPLSRDVYEEGALTFPCIKVQSGYRDVEDVVRMGRARIRVPDQWYGDYLATLASARIGERRLLELLQAHGAETIREFVAAWFDYCERRTAAAICRMRSGEATETGAHDPLPPLLSEPLPLQATIKVDADEGYIDVDLRDNPDCVDAGINLSQATAVASATIGVLNQLEEVPTSQGTLRRIRVQLRENCVAGLPRHPHSCSTATTGVTDRIIGIVQRALAQLGDGFGLAEGGLGMGPSTGVISGLDPRHDAQPFVNQVLMGASGGPGSPTADGWINFGMPCSGGLLYRDSVEVDEQKYPVYFREVRVAPGSEGAGRFRGSPSVRVAFGPSGDRNLTVFYVADGAFEAPRGVLGGADGAARRLWVEDAKGERAEVPAIGNVELPPGSWIVDVPSGGAGYGPPFERDPDHVLADVVARLVSVDAARDVYGVAIVVGDAGEPTVDRPATEVLRAAARGGSAA